MYCKCIKRRRCPKRALLYLFPLALENPIGGEVNKYIDFALFCLLYVLPYEMHSILTNKINFEKRWLDMLLAAAGLLSGK